MNKPKKLYELAQSIFTAETYIFCDDEVVMFKRSETKKKFPGFWSIPGGHIDEGEDPLVAAVREVTEETGITLNPKDMKLRAIALHHHIDRNELYSSFAFAVELPQKPEISVHSEEGQAFWVKKSEMFTKVNVFEPIRYYFDHILNNHPGILYNMSAWKDSKLVKVYSESVDKNI